MRGLQLDSETGENPIIPGSSFKPTPHRGNHTRPHVPRWGITQTVIPPHQLFNNVKETNENVYNPAL